MGNFTHRWITSQASAGTLTVNLALQTHYLLFYLVLFHNEVWLVESKKWIKTLIIYDFPLAIPHGDSLESQSEPWHASHYTLTIMLSPVKNCLSYNGCERPKNTLGLKIDFIIVIIIVLKPCINNPMCYILSSDYLCKKSTY